jgi:hypothetical protein
MSSESKRDATYAALGGCHNLLLRYPAVSSTGFLCCAASPGLRLRSFSTRLVRRFP